MSCFESLAALSPQGTSVFTAKARDPDTGINDPIRYSIERESAGDLKDVFVVRMFLYADTVCVL